eukprot:CAMPEP_0119306452 /NCGR_PEP_ID=MMETSP1333-20130426/7213_1 /TAXON_ID=418940 /ORGANISM="Scyphosphaera apsteinii, Strain RCC1455" /LENGTH=236 /DNA_ID=CAMNT_0007309761 /DNA_START=399 /DNA_END=1109 /DNA_ORIENTATION=+
MQGPLANSELQQRFRHIQVAILIAYLWDVICIASGVIPFSRVRRGSDIVGHHLPILCVFLPLGLPISFNLASIESALQVLDSSLHGPQAVGPQSFLLRIYAWGFVSSLNEFLMCAQRAEAPQGVVTAPKLWNARQVQLFELSYKLAIFVVFSMLSAIACLQLDYALWKHARMKHPTSSFFTLLACTYLTPIQIGTSAWRLFIITKYPKMAQQTWAKLKKYWFASGLDAEKPASLIQ